MNQTTAMPPGHKASGGASQAATPGVEAAWRGGGVVWERTGHYHPDRARQFFFSARAAETFVRGRVSSTNVNC